MDNQLQNPQEKQNNKRVHVFYLTIIGILGALCGILAWQFFDQKSRIETQVVEKTVFVKEKEDMAAVLRQLKTDYENLQTTNKGLQEELEQKKSYIDSLISVAEKHKNDRVIIAQLRRETETLRKIMQSYVHEIDSLNTLNLNLRAEKGKIEQELTSEKGKSSQLSKEKQELQKTVSLGSLLKASQFSAVGVRFKSGGRKESETAKARRAEKIKVTFNLGENRIAKSGIKDVYIRIITPDGKELCRSADEEHMFKFNGTRGFYAAKKSVDYQNSEMTVSVYCDRVGDEFLPGKYIIEVNADEATIGSTSLTFD